MYFTPAYERKNKFQVKLNSFFPSVLSQHFFSIIIQLCCCCWLLFSFRGTYIKLCVYCTRVNWMVFFRKNIFDFSFSFQILSVDAAFHSVSRNIFQFSLFLACNKLADTKAVAIKSNVSNPRCCIEETKKCFSAGAIILVTWFNF